MKDKIERANIPDVIQSKVEAEVKKGLPKAIESKEVVSDPRFTMNNSEFEVDQLS